MKGETSAEQWVPVWRGAFDDEEVSELHRVAFNQVDLWRHEWTAQLEHWSLGWVVVRDGDRLVGFLNVPWDGGAPAWLQEVIVDPKHQRSGIGRSMVVVAAAEAGSSACKGLHVDCDDDAEDFYLDGCGFRPNERRSAVRRRSES